MTKRVLKVPEIYDFASKLFIKSQTFFNFISSLSISIKQRLPRAHCTVKCKWIFSCYDDEQQPWWSYQLKVSWESQQRFSIIPKRKVQNATLVLTVIVFASSLPARSYNYEKWLNKLFVIRALLFCSICSNIHFGFHLHFASFSRLIFLRFNFIQF